MAWTKKQWYLSLLAPTSRRRWIGIAVIAILAATVYFYLAHSANRPASSAATPSSPDRIETAGRTLAKPATKRWVCPMHPDVIQDHPGECPICGMDLVEMEPAETPQPGHDHGVNLDTASLQKLGVRLASAEWRTLSQDIHTYGNVVADESLIFNLSAKFEGVIKKLHVNSLGQRVQAGQVIYEIYSPELLKAQFEFVELIREKDKLLQESMSEDSHISGYTMSEDEMMEVRLNAKQRNLYTEKFVYADAGNELVQELYTTYKPREIVEIRAPKAGFVTKIEVHEGSAVKPMDNLYSFANLSRVWIDVPLYPDQLAWVKDGDEVTVLPAKGNTPEIKAHLQFISPLIDSTTRTVLARLSVSNTKNQLLIGSFLDVIIHAKSHMALAVPRSAVMRTGQGDLVMRSEGSGHFTPVRVKTGIETGEFIEINAGLRDGDRVAVNGQFLLDAAASMSDAAQRLHNDAVKH
jgi:Cu(I)/Ag(I) efflux system membrane fusion protein